METTTIAVADEVVSYSSILADIHNQITVNSCIGTVQIVLLGAVIGVLLGLLFWGRFK